MKENNRGDSNLTLSTLLLLLIFSLMSFSGVVLSEEDQTQDAATAEEAEDDNDKEDEDVVELAPIVATGSRLLRQTYESISPVQVITAQESRAVGQINASDILQSSTAASGQQLDLTFSGFVLDNGPGSQNVSFRGLGEGRTLILLNGRRLAPAGVEGIPTAPDIGLIPGALIDRYELLLDGSSSIYGSDAVAGVANAILRKDFNGFEVDYTTSIPEQSNGVEQTLALTWGKNFDRGFVGFGMELNEREAVRFADRSWTARCSENREVDRNGNIHTENLASQERLMDFGGCNDDISLPVGRTFIPGGHPAGSIYYTPGVSTHAFGNFSDSDAGGARVPIDLDGDGQADVNWLDYDVSPFETGANLFGEFKGQSVMSYGEYTFEGESNITPFYEILYSRRDTFTNSGAAIIAPTVPGLNPYNLCNPDAVNGGVDCGDAYDVIFENQTFIDAYILSEGCDPSASGDCPQGIGSQGALDTIPIVAVQGDRNTVSTTVEQIRVVAGLRGDLPGLDFGQMSSWNFEVYLSHQRSEGVSQRFGIDQVRLDYSLETSRVDPNTGEVICGANDGCVPINLYAPSLYDNIGDFGTQAERNYLFRERIVNTEIRQTIFSSFINGYVYELPAGPIAAGIGIDLREDEINSVPNEVARDGLITGFFTDGGAKGKKSTKEIFAEVEIPLLAGYKGAEELTFNISGRLTKDEFFPSADTFSAKLGYRPIPSLLLKATIGTSYRAPNLRENFLEQLSGFSNISDPCTVPEEAYVNDEYDRRFDPRSETLLSNCTISGVDPTTHRRGFLSNYSTEIITGGSTDLSEEKSDSLTYGFAWDVPFDGDFNLAIGATYYEIEISNTIIEAGPNSIINGCLTNENGNSILCERFGRDEDGDILFVNSGFINRDNQTVRGVDVNINMDKSFDIFNKSVDFGMDIVMTHTKEISTLFLNDVADPTDDDFDDDASEFGFPSWSGTVNLRASWDNYRVTWQTRYIGNVSNDPFIADYFGSLEGIETLDVRDLDGDGRTDDFVTAFSDSCVGAANGGIDCRDIAYADAYFNHTLSVFYENNDWTLGFGVRNIFNDKPPEVDPSEFGGSRVIGNAPRGYGYDLNGRRYFINVSRRF